MVLLWILFLVIMIHSLRIQMILNSLKELLGHYMNEVNIVMKPTVMDFDGFKMALLPWITSRKL